MKIQMKLNKHFNTFRDSFIQRALNKSNITEDSLSYWRARILFTIFLAGLSFGFFALISGIVLFLKTKLYAALIFDTFGYGLFIFLLLSRKVRYEFRAAIALLTFYLVGVIIIFQVGPVSGGPIWLFTFAILVAVLLGSRAALAAVVINCFTLIAIARLIATGYFGDGSAIFKYKQVMVSAIVNFVVLNLIASQSISALLKGLISSHKSEVRLKNHLDQERKELISLKEVLELEVKERKEAEEKYRFLAENVNDMIWMTDLSTRELYYISPAVEKIRGFTIEEAKRQTLEEMLTPASYQKAKTTLIDELENDCDRDPDRFVTIELEHYRKNGSTIPTEMTASFVRDENGLPIALLGITRDISERKKVEKVLREKEEKLTRLKKMESLGLMAGGIAHDLNNLLSGIVSYPDLILTDLPQDSPMKESLEIIKESGIRASTVVSDLLTVARGVATARGTTNLNTVIEEYVGSPEHKKLVASRPTINFNTQLEDQLLNMVVSPIHIKKALMNLTINAADAIKGEGTVTISSSNCYLDEPLPGYEDVQPGEYVVLKVSDNGVGIPREHLQKIFEPFYTKKIMGRGGTGLGLAIVWNTMKDHDGYINVKSGDNGTQFELYFPASHKEISAPKLKSSIEAFCGKGERILVVDDEDIQRKITCGLLEKLGYDTQTVASGEEAVQYLKNHTVDLILLDMFMPNGLNGRETYEKIIDFHPDQKAIIASGFAETDDVKEAQKFGSCPYVKKPYTLEEIGQAIKTELQR